jgi:hypothetical protein
MERNNIIDDRNGTRQKEQNNIIDNRNGRKTTLLTTEMEGKQHY